MSSKLLLTRASGFFAKEVIYCDEGNNDQCESDLSLCHKFIEIHSPSKISSALTALSSSRAFRSEVHEGDNRTNQAELNEEKTPKDSYIIDVHTNSFNTRIPSIKNITANVNPANAKRIWGKATSGVKRPNTQEPTESFEISKQYFANSSLWRFVIVATLTNHSIPVNQRRQQAYD